MKLVTSDTNKQFLKITKAEWEKIGHREGWMKTALNVVVQDMGQTITLPQSIRKPLSNALYAVLKPTYFDGIPMQQIMDSFKTVGVSVIQEDGTEWSGMFTGREGRANIELAFNGKVVENAALALTWHKMEKSGKFEVVGYIS
jgi:hypothetical protein